MKNSLNDNCFLFQQIKVPTFKIIKSDRMLSINFMELHYFCINFNNSSSTNSAPNSNSKVAGLKHTGHIAVVSFEKSFNIIILLAALQLS